MSRAASLTATVLLGLATLSGCAAEPVEPATTGASPVAVEAEPEAPDVTVRVASLKGPTTMGLVGLMRDDEEGTAAQDYELTMYGAPDEIVPLLTKGEVDAALIPANLAAVLHAKTSGGVRVAAITTLGMLEVLEQGDTIHSVADLAGRTVYSTGKGASPEHVLNHLLTRNGLDPATDVRVEYRSEATEVAALLAADPQAVGILPQPYVTALKAQQPQVRTALRLAQEWTAVSPDSQMVTGVVVVRTAFAQEHPEAVEVFLTELEASTDLTNSDPAQVAPLIVEAGIVPSAAVAEAAVPACNITFIDGAEMTTALGGYLAVLAEADPASVGGSVPGDDFYHRR